jgi:hypothetical protein
MSAEGQPALTVDVLINNHNYGRFLAAAIESACGQTHDPVRVIVVDDGSSDDSRSVLAGYEGRVDAVLKENGGQASAINAGMERSTGDVVIFLDSDDVLGPEAAARAAAVFAADPRVVKVQSKMEVIDASGTPTGEIKPPSHLAMPRGDMRAAELAYPFDIPWMATSANAFRAEALRRILPVPEAEYPGAGADWYLVHLATLLGDVASLEEVSALYRVHGANSYEPQQARLDLDHLRMAIRLAEATSGELLALAARLSLPGPDRILSIADLANRMVSIKLDPGRHPVEGDRAGRLVLDAIGAARRRADASLPLRLMFCGWFAAMAVAPASLARRLADLFLFPQRRASLNRLLGRLQRPGRRTSPVAS